MAVSERIMREAERTIAGIQEFYRDYGEWAGSKEEMENRIRRVEAVKEGCNGLTQEEKIQKTAENVFELTCAQERFISDVRKDIKLTRDAIEKGQKSTAEGFAILRNDLESGLRDITTKIEESCADVVSPARPKKNMNGIWVVNRIIAENPGWAFFTFIFFLILTFVSGHFEAICGLFKVANAAAQASGAQTGVNP